jgi:hypothetical protein
MTFIERNHVVQQISPATSNPTLGNSILPGTAKARSHRLQADGFQRIANRFAELGIAVKDQILVFVVIRKGFAELLGDPQAGWMPSDIAVQDLSPIMCNDKKAVDRKGNTPSLVLFDVPLLSWWRATSRVRTLESGNWSIVIIFCRRAMS